MHQNDTPQSRLYAIGDIHGHCDQLEELIGRLVYDDGMVPGRDCVVFLGDYVDRGPNSKRTVEAVRASLDRYPHWRALRGNHEQMMLDALERGPEDWGTWAMWWYQGGRETVASFAGLPVRDVQPKDASAIPDDVVTWMRELPSGLIYDERYAFAHAGFSPVENWYHNTDPSDMIWIRDEFLESDFDFGRVIVHGHTPITEPVVKRNRIGIDTVLKTGRLTAVELSCATPRFIQSA